MKVEIELPFSGFYESIHDDNITRMIEDGFNYNHETGEEQEAPEAVWNAPVDYGSIHKEYAKEYVEMFGDKLELDLEFIAMTSPREYNFSTDRVFAEIPKEQIDKIRKEVEAHDKWGEYIKERFTSRSGFMSFYSEDSKDEEWTKDVLDECQYRVVLEFWLENISLETDEWELWLMDDFIGSRELESIGVAHEVIEEQIKKEKRDDTISGIVKDFTRNIDWMVDAYNGKHNMPDYAYETVTSMEVAIKELEGLDDESGIN